jgi:hypothetical protein
MVSCKNFLSIRRSFDYPIKLKTTKNKTRQQKAKSPKAFSGVTDLNSDDVVSCNRRETAMKDWRRKSRDLSEIGKLVFQSKSR